MDFPVSQQQSSHAEAVRDTRDRDVFGILLVLYALILYPILRADRYYNDDLAEYLIPVNADITRVETIFLPEQDRQVNDLGIKGIGELGNVGLNAAVANAVFHATGVRIRELPIRIEKLLTA